MWQQQVFVLTVYVALGHARAGFKSGTSGLPNNDPHRLELNLNAWQPLRGENNWLILQATPPTAMQQQQQQQQQQREQPQQQPHGLPVNYYAYNHRYQSAERTAANDDQSGNYKQVRPNLNANPSYVWALRPALRQLSSVQNQPEVRKRDEPEAREVNTHATYPNIADEGIEVLAKPSATAQRLSNYLEAFDWAVLRVRRFCDSVRELLSESEEPDDWEQPRQLEWERQQYEQEQDLPAQLQPQIEQAARDSAATKWHGRAEAAGTAAGPSGALAGAATTTSKEVQGRGSHLAMSYQGRKLKKLKKKIQKLFFPLLIAYKLKFLTLIPVLIGGLTLLVGTTGLAGFFFALFTAVMSLKSSAGHASKAIVLKKI